MELINTSIRVALAWYALISVFLFFLYALDKKQAQIGGRRIPERTLHLTALVGGFLGGLFGRAVFRHKTRKPVFLIIMLMSAIIHTIFWVLLFI